MGSNATERRGIPDATVTRLPEYLQALTSLTETGVSLVSSEELAALVGVGSAKLRKDLSHLGSYGVRGVGETKYIVVYSRKNETPMAVMSTEMRGAWRNGL